MKVVLASASPRRKQLLKLIFDDFDVLPADVEEKTSCTDPVGMVKELSLMKASWTAQRCEADVVIGADTVVALDGKILGKPKDEDDAVRMLKSLSGRTHLVATGVTVITKEQTVTFADTSLVTFKTLCDKDIADYVATGSPLDKAGAYGVQDSGFVQKTEGSYHNVMGLPVEKLEEILKHLGGRNG